MTTARQPRNKAPLRLAENGIICVGVFQRYPADPGDRADPAVDPAEEGGPDAREGQDGRDDPGGLSDLSDLVCPGAPDDRCHPVDPDESEDPEWIGGL